MHSFAGLALALLALVLLGVTLSASANAQVDPRALQRALRDQNSDDSDDESLPGGSRSVRPTVQTFQPAVRSAAGLAQSDLEDIYAKRSGLKLTQFGYDVMGVPATVQVGQVGAAQDSYVLGQGDEVRLVLRGQENATYRQRVNRDGQLIFPKLNPTVAAGRTFGEVRAELDAQVHQAFISTNAFITMGEVRQVSVLVSGEVNVPGQRILSAMGTPLDALLLSGGITKKGTLRNVKLIRGGETRTLDLYALLTSSGRARLGNLQDGDRIYVPTLGRTVAVSGPVRSPGIFELPPGASAISARELVNLAGGLQTAGSFRFAKIVLTRDGGLSYAPTTMSATVRDGEVFMVSIQGMALTGRVDFEGALQTTGDRALSMAPTVGKVIASERDLMPNAYTPFAVVVRTDVRSNARTLIPFSLESIFGSGPDLPLKQNDIVYIFNVDEISAVSRAATASPSTQQKASTEPRGPANPRTIDPDMSGNTDMSGPQEVSNIDLSTPVASALAGSNPHQGPAPTIRDIAPQASLAITAARREATKEGFVSYAEATSAQVTLDSVASALGVPGDTLQNTANDYLVWVLDEVGNPGPYLSAEGTSLRSIIHVAGGALRQADLSWVEVTSTQIDTAKGTASTVRVAYKGQDEDFTKAIVRPLDVIRLRRVFSDAEQGRMSITGEVRYPGTFDIIRGERLSAVIERAGGMTDQAYPYGAVFTRTRAALTEKESNERAAKSIESALATLATLPTRSTEDSNSTSMRLNFLSNLADRLRASPALGRISAVVDPAILRAQPELDIVVQPGDAVYIPKRPATINVSGEVLNPGAFQYRPDYTLSDYTSLAGGMTQGADEDRVFVVLPDGSAQPVRQSWIAFQDRAIPPGSTIIIPRDLNPFNFTQFATTIATIVSQLAISAASIAVIGNR